METIKKEGFKIIGIKVRTTNENGEAAKAIGGLWNQFMSEKLIEKIPNLISPEIFSIYTNYESDHTKPYDTILGCKVNSLEEIPNGMIGQEFQEETYVKFTAKGNLNEGAVYNKWSEIWNTDLNRTYSADLEIYGEKAQDPTNSEVDIYIAVKN